MATTAAELTHAPAIPRETTATAAAKPPRWMALDFLRLLAVLLMVQGHTFYVVVAQSVKDQPWYGWHGYVHGFTAPLFLFSAGMAFGITTFRRWDDHLTWGKTVAKRFERYLILLGIGYALQLGTWSLATVLSLPAARLEAVTRIDALHHIAIVLALCEALVLVLRTKKRFVAAISALCALSVFGAPWVWNIDVTTLPIPLAAYVNDHTGSIFPLVPWSGFIFGGLLTAYLLSKADGSMVRRPGLWLAGAGLALYAMGKAFPVLGFDPFPEHNAWKTGPWFFCLRVGIVLMVLATLCGLEYLLVRRRRGVRTSLLQTIGQETLVIYVAHLMVLYGSPINPSLRAPFEGRLDLLPSIGMAAAVFGAMVLLAWVWHRLKRTQPVAFDRVRYAVTAVLVAAFLFS